MASPGRPKFLGPGEVFLLALLVLFPLGPRFATGVGNIYLATVFTLAWLGAWTLFVFAGPRGGLSVATAPQQALLGYAGFLVLQMFLHLGGLLGRPAILFRAVQLVAYMGLFATVSSLRLDEVAVRRFVRLSLAVLVVECALAWVMREKSLHGFLAGTFDNEHNSFAAYLVLTLPVVLAHLSFASGMGRRAFLALVLAIGVASLALSLSRTAYIAFPAALLAVVHRRWGGRAALVALALSIAVVLAFGLIVPASVTDRFGSIFGIFSGTETDISFLTRLGIWREAIDEFVRTGLVGVGLYGIFYVDNYYVRALAETGVVGFALFIALLAAIIGWLWRACNRMRDPETRALALGLYGATVGLLVVANVAADAFLVHRVMGLYWILFGSLVALDLAARRREREEPVPSGPVVRRGP